MENPPMKSVPKKDDSPKVGMSREEVLRSEIDQVAPETKVRSDRQKLAEPVGRIEFDKYMTQIVQFINDYFDESHKQSVIPEADASTARLKTPIPDKSDSCLSIIEDLKKAVVPNMCHTQHPRYHAKFSGRCLADTLATTLSAALGCDSNCSPMVDVIERVLCNWMSQAMQLPKMKRCITDEKAEKEPIGTVLYTPTDVYLCLILNWKARNENYQESTSDLKRHYYDYVVYCSDDAHYPLEEACVLGKVKLRKVITAKEDCHGMTGSRLEKQIIKDLERQMTPLLIVSTFGSANLGANDNLKEIVKIAEKFNIPVHCDASYAGFEWIEPTKRSDVHKYLSNVQSVHVNFNTLLPYSGNLSILWSAEKFVLEHGRINRNGGDTLKLWILIRLYGMKALREAVRRKVNLGNILSDRLTHQSEFAVLHPNEHGIVLFQYYNTSIKGRTTDANTLTSMFYSYMVESAQMKCGFVKFNDKIMLRACINYEKSNASIMEESVSTLLNIVDEFEEKMKTKNNLLKMALKSEFVEQIGGSPNQSTEGTPPTSQIETTTNNNIVNRKETNKNISNLKKTPSKNNIQNK
ncbi:unnamed protein product [Caenorhabditis bovis]|uniref:Uncharacterized protein n=1 Tax=Caenorhabditis bovis TaxID=2654633 RepID=A0A8S1ERQ7_9PELO|nr:unnamed protein product [Caenorhabditis bovis]